MTLEREPSLLPETDEQWNEWAKEINPFGIDQAGKPIVDQRKLLEMGAMFVATWCEKDREKIPSLHRMAPTKENEFITKIHSEMQSLQARGKGYDLTFRTYFRRAVANFSDEIKQRKAYSILVSLSRRIKELADSDELKDHDLQRPYEATFQTLYDSVCGPERFLVFARGFPVWKRIKLRENTTEELWLQRGEITKQVATKLHHFDEDIATVIPDYFLLNRDLSKLQIPKSARSIEESLEDAFYNKHYFIPPEGAEVYVRNAGDLEKFTILEKNGLLWSKATTEYGDQLMTLDLDDATLDSEGVSSIVEEAEKFQDLGRILAEVYRDMSVSVIRPIGSRSKGSISVPKPLTSPEQFRWTYIPRTRRIPRSSRQSEEQRRSPRPHYVPPFLRRGNITEKHRREIQIYEQQTGLRILENLPAGRTPVRGFVRPKDSIDQIAELPRFMKRRIERQIRESIDTDRLRPN